MQKHRIFRRCLRVLVPALVMVLFMTDPFTGPLTGRTGKRPSPFSAVAEACPDVFSAGVGFCPDVFSTGAEACPDVFPAGVGFCLDIFSTAAGRGRDPFLCTVHAEEGYDQVAPASSMGKVNEDLAPYGMTPVSGSLIEDGEYVVGTESSSSFFRIEEARITVRDGRITALLKMYSFSYPLVYPGTAEEAAAAPYEDYIPSVEVDGWDTFTIPVEALDMPVDLAAFSRKKKKWYPRKVLFHASDIPADCLKFAYPDYEKIAAAMAAYEGSGAGATETRDPSGNDENENEESVQAAAGPADLTAESGTSQGAGGLADRKAPETASADSGEGAPQAAAMDLPDGNYSIEVSLAGGSGRASVTSPTWLTVKEGRGYARLLWSSSYYDYMILDGVRYDNETTDGSASSFTIPITALDTPVEVIADTTAMGDPVEIQYTLTFYPDTVGSSGSVPQEAARRVLTGALLFMVVGGIANHFVKKSRQ